MIHEQKQQEKLGVIFSPLKHFLFSSLYIITMLFLVNVAEKMVSNGNSMCERPLSSVVTRGKLLTAASIQDERIKMWEAEEQTHTFDRQTPEISQRIRKLLCDPGWAIKLTSFHIRVWFI